MTTSSKGEGVNNAIVRPEERDQQVLTERILAGEEGHVGFPELKPQDHNMEETLKYVLGRELISEKKNKLQLNTARNEVVNR